MGMHKSIRSEEHTSELQSRVDISYAVFCLKKKNQVHHAGAAGRAESPGRHRHGRADRDGAVHARRASQPPCRQYLRFFFFNDTATTEIYTLSLHDALPISTSCYVTDNADLILMREGLRMLAQ